MAQTPIPDSLQFRDSLTSPSEVFDDEWVGRGQQEPLCVVREPQPWDRFDPSPRRKQFEARSAASTRLVDEYGTPRSTDARQTASQIEVSEEDRHTFGTIDRVAVLQPSDRAVAATYRQFDFVPHEIVVFARVRSIRSAAEGNHIVHVGNVSGIYDRNR